MSFDNTKYDVELNTVPYRIRGYQKAELSTFIPRFTSGDQSQSDFSLLRARTVESFDAGILQRYFDDARQVFATEQMYPIFDDGTLYPVNAPTSATDIMGKAIVTAKVHNTNYMFLACQGFTGTIFVQRVDTAGTVTSITIPAACDTEITSMVIKDNELWFADFENRLYRMALSSTTATEITGGSGGARLLAVYGGQLYGTYATAGGLNAILYRYTGTTTTKVWVEVGRTPTVSDSLYARLFVFNNRLILTRNDGMFAWDGIKFGAIEDLSQSVNDANYMFATTLKGYIYYMMEDGFYRFNGSLIEKLYDTSEVGIGGATLVDMVAGKGRLWLLYKNTSVVGSRYDKSMGYDYSGGNEVDGRVMCFNGKAMYTYTRTNTFTKNPGSDDVTDQGSNHRVHWFANKLYVFTYFDKIGSGTYYKVDTNELGLSGSKPWRVVTSIDDGEFPMIDKSLDNLELVFDGDVASDQDITIEYRTTGFDGSTSWTALGTIKTQSRTRDYVHRVTPAGITYRRIQFRFSGTTDVRYGISKIITRYMLSPDLKFQWTFTALAYGDEDLAPLMLADGTESTQAVSLLRGNIYNARMSDVPIRFIDIDQLDLSGAHTDAVTTITLNTTYMLKESGFVQIDDEIISYTGKTSTTLTGCSRAQLGTVAAAHSDNAKVFALYRVVIRQLQNERVELQDKSLDTVENSSHSSEVTLVIQEV